MVTRPQSERLDWFIAFSQGDCQESDAREISDLFCAGDVLDTYPLPVRAPSRDEAARIAGEWASTGPFEDAGNITIERSSRACWLVRL